MLNVPVRGPDWEERKKISVARSATLRAPRARYRSVVNRQYNVIVHEIVVRGTEYFTLQT